MAKCKLKGCRLEVGAPVEVDRHAGHFWFPTLHAVSGEDVLCSITTADDKAQGEWPAVLYRSQDGGRSWKRACDIRYSPAATVLAPGKVLLMPYELWPLAPGEKRNLRADGTTLTCTADGSVSAERTPVKLLGFPRDLADYHESELRIVANGNILPLRDGRLFMTVYGTFDGEEKYDVFAMSSDDGGRTWEYVSTVARWQDTPGANEGPDESNTVRLADGRLMCVSRVGGGQEFYKCYSADDAATWSKPERMAGVWSVEPKLVRLDGGVILLSSGREGLFLWVCADGAGRAWERFNLAEHHNAHVADAAMRYAEDFLQAKGGNPAYSTAYTGILAVGPDEALVCYDRLGNGWAGSPGPWGEKDAVFCVRVKSEPASR